MYWAGRYRKLKLKYQKVMSWVEVLGKREKLMKREKRYLWRRLEKYRVPVLELQYEYLANLEILRGIISTS